MEDGLDWIVRHQRADGCWSLNFQDQCRANGCPPQPRHRVGHRGDRPGPAAPARGRATSTPRSAATRTPCAGASSGWSQHQQPNGDLFVGGAGIAYLYSHAIATMALCEAYGLSRDPQLRGAGPAGARLHRRVPEHRDRRLAVLPGPGGRHLGLRLADLRPAERPPGRADRPPSDAPRLPRLPRPGRRPTPKKITLRLQPGRSRLAGHDRRGPGQPAAPGLAARTTRP